MLPKELHAAASCVLLHIGTLTVGVAYSLRARAFMMRSIWRASTTASSYLARAPVAAQPTLSKNSLIVEKILVNT
jgi:hypothetical protein